MQLNKKNHIYTVSQLTSNIKALLEEKFPFIWISGEISNFSIPASGHFYFTLRDEKSQISAVMFRGQNRNLKFMPENGISITGFGRIAVYEPRGTYQIMLEYLEPEGMGAILAAYEQLKSRLAAEGLFDQKHKQPLPFLPRKISIITSPSGAVVHDIMKIINRRFPAVHIEIIPVKVQGRGADKEIVSAFKLLNERSDADIAILARGGGSFEDLFVFNTEDVARAVFESKIPVISAIGHETDFTIADFVADLRAPTPSAAAEIVLPQKEELEKRCLELYSTLKYRLYKYLEHLNIRLNELSRRVVDPKRKIQDLRLEIDDYSARLIRVCTNNLNQTREYLKWRSEKLYLNNPISLVKKHHAKLKLLIDNMLSYLNVLLIEKRSALAEQTGRLHALSPASILARGYSITQTIPDNKIVTSPDQVFLGQEIKVLVEKGSLICRVERKSDNGRTDI